MTQEDVAPDRVEFVAFGPRSRQPLGEWTALGKGKAGPWPFEECGLILSREAASQRAATPGGQVFELRARGPWPEAWARIRLGPFSLPKGTDWAVAHGWQCWSESPFVHRDDLFLCDERRERWVFGDPVFYPYEDRVGACHSWFFSWCGRSDRPELQGFFGAEGSRRIAVAFVFDLRDGKLWVDCDTEGLELPHDAEQTLCRFVLPEVLSGDMALAEGLREWAGPWRRLEGSHAPAARQRPLNMSLPIRGYTSWYHHYNAISVDLLQQNLDAAPSNMKVFQIDDGYQKSVGEWTELRNGFGTMPQMREFIRRVRDRGLVPGLWLAPFVVAQGSQTLSKHPQWLLRDSAGEPIRVGHIPHWGGDFFALDTERDDVRHWIDEVVSFWTNEGVGFFKCDFLYAPGVKVGRRGPVFGQDQEGTLTRLHRAYRAHEFLYDRISAHGAVFLSCGAIIEQALHACDVSRVGADVGQTWDDSDPSMRWSREKVSTRAALLTTIIRSPLSQAGLRTDGDVSIVRSFDTSLSFQERRLLAWVNSWASDLQFVSCDTFAWDDEARAIYALLDGDDAHPEFTPAERWAVVAIWPQWPTDPDRGGALDPKVRYTLNIRMQSDLEPARFAELCVDLLHKTWTVRRR